MKGVTDKGAGLELRKESSLLREAAAGVRAELLLLRCTSSCVGVAGNFEAERGASEAVRMPSSVTKTSMREAVALKSPAVRERGGGQLRRHGDSLLMMFVLMFTPQQRYIRTREAAELRLGILLAAARALL